MPQKYELRDEPGKTMFVFEKNGKVYGHVVKNKTDKAPAKFVFETAKFDSVQDLKAEYPVIVWQNGSILDYGGTIESHTDHSVTINGAKYLKATCEFNIR